MKEATEIIKNIQPKKSAYDRTLYLIYNYRDLKNGREINEEARNVLKLIDRAVELIKDDRNIEIIYMTLQGKTVEEIAELKNMDDTSVYRQRRRLIKRLSIIFYGEEAL